jgi:hypothetical protein
MYHIYGDVYKQAQQLRRDVMGMMVGNPHAVDASKRFLEFLSMFEGLES